MLTVHPAVRGFWGGTLHYEGDESLTDKARAAAQAETDKVLAGRVAEHAKVPVTITPS